MTMPDFSSPRAWGTVAALILAMGGGTWAWTSRSGSESPTGLPEELSVKALKAQILDPGKMRETMREARERDDLTEEQRRELRGNMRRVWRQAMTDRVDEYLEADPKDQVAILDEQIDQFQEQMKAWEKRREEMQRERERGGESGQRPRQRPQRTREQRKERSEARNPDDTARTMIYIAALQQRMAERGIQMPGGPGGGGPGMRFGRRGP